jgi:hypothetical protein
MERVGDGIMVTDHEMEEVKLITEFRYPLPRAYGEAVRLMLLEKLNEKKHAR